MTAGRASSSRCCGSSTTWEPNWALSGVKVEPVTEQAAKAAAELLKDAGLHGHKYAIDATVAEVALRQPKPVALLTSDSDDMTGVCGNQVRIIPL